ncbi:aminotransferase class IV [Cohnella panacarvi]|uniref:aminotransferase class IV n=1 Tax=Cohnella panacarvi TaxID=400776 RepID=UPI00047D17F9|nr:aminotransferase class IV [Cohnella panacarvi]
MKLLWNGQVTDGKTTVISAFDHGFLYGMGLFETFRTYGGEPWLLDRHAARLRAGCELLGIAYELDEAGLGQRIARLLEANDLGDGYIRLSVSAGEGAIGLPGEAYERPNEIIYAKSLAPDHPDTRGGKTLRLLKQPRSTPESAIRLKSFHYMNNIVAKRELAAAGAGAGTEGLFADGGGHIVEGMVSNVFWLTDGILYTPSEETGLLPGITRGFVLELAAEIGLPVRQGLYRWEELTAADEVFLTSSIQEIVPVTRLEDERGKGCHPGGTAAIGPTTSRLMRLYRNRAEGTSGL